MKWNVNMAKKKNKHKKYGKVTDELLHVDPTYMTRVTARKEPCICEQMEDIYVHWISKSLLQK
jgi:hypothetical protein